MYRCSNQLLIVKCIVWQFQLLIPENDEAILRVVRSRSSVGTVIVEWAVSNEGRSDLEPDNGTLVFPEVKIQFY